MSQFLFLLISWKAPKSFILTSAPHDYQEPSAKKKKKKVLDRVPSSPKSLIYQASPTSWASQVAQTVKNLPSMRETWVWSLGWEDLLQKGMATHTSILAWRIPCTEEPGASLLTQSVKNLPAVEETQVWFLGWEDPWEKEMATHPSILAWRIPRGAWQDGVRRVGHDLATTASPPLHHTLHHHHTISATWKAVSWTRVPILPQINLNSHTHTQKSTTWELSQHTILGSGIQQQFQAEVPHSSRDFILLAGDMEAKNKN